jgi:hypothetical protein
MKYSFIIILLLLALVVQAQKTELIKGKWRFSDVADKAKLDSVTLKEAEILFRNMMMEFSSNGQYLFGATAVGTWALNKEETKVLISSNGRTNEWEIKGLTDKELKLNMGKAVIVFGRPIAVAKETVTPPKSETIVQQEKDKKSKEVLALYSRHDADHRPKIKALLKYLEGSMQMDKQGNFNRSAWTYYSSQIKDEHCKGLYENIDRYRKDIEGLALQPGENELVDRLLTYLTSAAGFVKTCEVWANNISQKDLDDDSILKLLERLEKNSNQMVRDDNGIFGFLSMYKQRNGL